MEFDVNRESGSSKEVRCKDCGENYTASLGALSSSCPKCGNVIYFGAEVIPLRPVEILSRRVLAQLQEVKPQPEFFTRHADGMKTEELMSRFQTEWQLWVAVVENFAEPEYHAAYLALVSQSLQFDIATERYENHSKAMSSLWETRWQTEVCDVMLSRIRAIALVQCERELARPIDQATFLTAPLFLFSCFVAALIFAIHLAH